jgi:fumarate hydratase subunit alpha
MVQNELIINKVKDTLVQAGSTFREDQKEAYCNAIKNEELPRAKWVMETILENANVAERECSPLCDDTGIPHLFIEVGPNRSINGEFLEAIKMGVAKGLRELPGRPMAIKGDDKQRLDQSGGLDEDPGALLPAPIIIKPVSEDVIRLHVLMFGGGPAIRGKTYRVFHKHNVSVVTDEITSWAQESVALLGCSPCTLAVGIGRSQFEATSMMIEAMVYGNYNVQSDLEKQITEKVNEINVGPIGLNGKTSVLATFLKVGPQRASGVRIVCLRPCCCYEPRIASVLL